MIKRGTDVDEDGNEQLGRLDLKSLCRFGVAESVRAYLVDAEEITLEGDFDTWPLIPQVGDPVTVTAPDGETFTFEVKSAEETGDGWVAKVGRVGGNDVG